jgi:hypothetical protein
VILSSGWREVCSGLVWPRALLIFGVHHPCVLVRFLSVRLVFFPNCRYDWFLRLIIPEGDITNGHILFFFSSIMTSSPTPDIGSLSLHPQSQRLHDSYDYDQSANYPARQQYPFSTNQQLSGQSQYNPLGMNPSPLKMKSGMRAGLPTVRDSTLISIVDPCNLIIIRLRSNGSTTR